VATEAFFVTPVDLALQSETCPSELREPVVEGQHLASDGQSAVPDARPNGISEDTPGSPGSQQERHGPSAAIALRESALEFEVAELRGLSLSPNTQRGYAADWRNFSTWCAARGREALPASADTAALYMADRSATLANASLTRAIAAISRQHREVGFQSPTQDARFRQLMAGIRRKNRAPQDAKQALLVEDPSRS